PFRRRGPGPGRPQPDQPGGHRTDAGPVDAEGPGGRAHPQGATGRGGRAAQGRRPARARLRDGAHAACAHRADAGAGARRRRAGAAADLAQAVVRRRVDATAAARPAKVSGPSVNPDTLVFEAAAEADREAAPPRAMGDEVIRFVNRLIVGALDREASDVHIEPT